MGEKTFGKASTVNEPAAFVPKMADIGIGEAQPHTPNTIYHRRGDSPEVIQKIQAEGELWGRVPRNYYQSSTPAVKAYTGPLPEGVKGFEFKTPVAPSSGSHPKQPFWYEGTPGVSERFMSDGDEWVKISCTVTKVCE